MMGQHGGNQDRLFYSFNFDAHVPADHLLRGIDRFLDLTGYFLEHANFEPADPLRTPEHIAPVWYFTPFYAILRAVPNKLAGVALMGAAVVLLAFVPWLDRGKVRSIRYRGPIFKVFLISFAISFVALGWLGLQPATPGYTNAARVFGFVYFAFFLLMPWYTRIDRTREPPERVSYHPK